MKKILIVLMFVSQLAVAQEIKDFSLVNIRDGKTVSITSLATATGAVIIFTSHECPFDNYYKDRIKELAVQYSGKVPFILINSNQEMEESVEQMTIHYKDLNVPYLADKEQVAMEIFGVRKSTEAFLISKGNGKLTVVYSGAIDDNPQVPGDVKQFYLKDAIEKLLTGQKIEAVNQRASGCTIRRK